MWQAIAVCVALVTLFIGLIVHAVATAWWASKLTTTVEGIGNSLVNINKEFEKRDELLKAQWSKIDNLKDRVIALETKSNGD